MAAVDSRYGFATIVLAGVLVYRLGHGPLKAERRVRFPCALPLFIGHFEIFLEFLTNY